MKLKEMWQGLISVFKAKEVADVRIPTQAETDLWVANRQAEYKRQQQQEVVDRKERILPDLKKDIADMFLRTGKCTLFLYCDWHHQYHLCADENWAERKQFCALKWLWDDNGFTTIRVSWERIK